MFPDWLVHSLEGVQSIFRLPSVTILGIELDTIVHFALILVVVAILVGRDRARLGIGISVGLALIKETLDVVILVNYRDVERFLPDILFDLLAAAAAIGLGIWLGRALRARRGLAHRVHDEAGGDVEVPAKAP